MAQVADFPDWWWDSFESFDDDTGEEYEPCALCSHDMVSECGLGEQDYFVTGQHICVCCSQDEPDTNEEQPQDNERRRTRPPSAGGEGEEGE